METAPRTARFSHLRRISYRKCYELQAELHAARVANTIPDTLLLLEHNPVITLGRGSRAENLLLSADQYIERNIEVIETDRGGDVTFHGPGQLVGYPIFDLDQHGRDLHRYLRDLEEVILTALRAFGVTARRFPPHTGVWVEDRKICAIGIRVSRWVSMHGFALNVTNDRFGFDTIVPCGIAKYPVTSLQREVGEAIELERTTGPILAAFEEVFHLRFEV